MFPAKPVGNLTNFLIVFFCRDMELFACYAVHRVEHKVGMDMPLVRMGSNDHLKSGQTFLRKFFCYFQRQLRCNLSGLEGLDDVIALPSASLSNFFLCPHHLLICPARVTVQERSQHLIFCFFTVQYIFYRNIQARVASENLCYRHYFLAS